MTYMAGFSDADHVPESTYQDRVISALRDEYGDDNVRETVYLEESYRFADVWVEGPVVDFAMEIENDFEAVLKGIGQSELYAAHEFDEPNVVPVIIVPPEHVVQPEADMLRERGFNIVEYDVD